MSWGPQFVLCLYTMSPYRLQWSTKLFVIPLNLIEFIMLCKSSSFRVVAAHIDLKWFPNIFIIL